MKPLAFLCTLVLCLSLAACAQTPSAGTTVPTTAPTAASTTVPPNPTTKTVYVHTSVTSTSDTMDARTDYLYDFNNCLTEVIQYSGTTQTQRYAVSCDENGNFIRWEATVGPLELYIEYAYDGQGNKLGNSLYQSGELSGERMPEDANPSLNADSRENALYFTLPMALNYQRSAYALWESAAATWADEEARDAFFPEQAVRMGGEELRHRLLRHRLALQPNRHPAIWSRLCETFMEDFDGDVRRLFEQCGYSVEKVRDYFAGNKKRLPYLGGEKIMNYWLPSDWDSRCG